MLPDTSEQSAGHSRIPGLRQTVLDVILHALILLKVFRDEFRGFVGTDAELLRKTVWSLSIHDAEVDGLCPVPLHRSDLIDGQPENRGGRTPVNIFSG